MKKMKKAKINCILYAVDQGMVEALNDFNVDHFRPHAASRDQLLPSMVVVKTNV